MIKTKDVKTTACGTKEGLLAEFAGTAESLLRKTTITAEELHKAVKLAEMTVKMIDKIGAFFADEVQDYEPAEEEDEAEEEEPEKGKLRVGKFEADDIDGMLEWLKGQLENLEDESDD